MSYVLSYGTGWEKDYISTRGVDGKLHPIEFSSRKEAYAASKS